MPGPWAAVAAVSGDATGRLYGVAHTGPTGSNQVIWVADVSPSALGVPDAQDACVHLSGLSVTQVISTSPPLNFDVTAASASADGHQLLLWGTEQGDVPVPVLALVDIYGSQPMPQHRSSGSGSAAAAAAAAAAALHPSAKQRLATLHYVHQGLYSERPGMSILQVTWHPSSSSHFAALASDNRWRLYHSSHLLEAEQTFWLRPPGSQAASSTLGLRRGAGSSSSSTPQRFTGFAFGPPDTGSWASLAVLLLASDGGVYVLCPVAPFGLRMQTSVLQQLLDASEGTAHAWLLAAFLSLLSQESAAVPARPHMLETAAPALQGPLNQGADSIKLKPTRSIACTLAVTNAVNNTAANPAGDGFPGEDVLQQQQPGFSVVATGFSNGVVYAHALEVGQVVPVWLDSTPQCVFDHKGEIAAVRYEADAVRVLPATAGLPSVPEDRQQQQAAAAADVVSPLLLLDALKINLHLPPEKSGDWEFQEDDWQDDGGRAGSVTDSEEESDAGYDPSATGRGAAAAKGLGFGSRGLQLGLLDDDDDADDDVEDQQLLQLRKVMLHVAPELPGRFWACHDQGCWGINIRWLQQLAGRPDAAAAGGVELVAPSLQELLVADTAAAAGGGVVSSCVVGNALLGSGCAVLEGSGELWFLRPRPAGVLGDGVLGGAVAGQGSAGEAEGLAAGLEGGQGLVEVRLTPEEQDVQSRMEDFYSDICRGPRRLPPPPKPQNLSQLTAADPAGLSYLNAMASWLLSTHVQFATGAHADLAERLKQLHAEVGEQSSALSVLQRLAAAASAHQDELASRIARLQEVASNLAERGSLLAGLHWSLPRPASVAEQQLDKQLEVWEQQCNQLKVSWRSLRGRIDSYTATAAAQQQQQAAAAAGAGGGTTTPLHSPAAAAAAAGTTNAAGSRSVLGVPALAASRTKARVPVTAAAPGPVAAAQLDKLKQALAAQNDVIADARSRLAGLFEEVEGFRVEHPEVELSGKLRSQLVV